MSKQPPACRTRVHMQYFTSRRTVVFTLSFRISLSLSLSHIQIFFIGVKSQMIHEALNKINNSDVLLDKEQYNFKHESLCMDSSSKKVN